MIENYRLTSVTVKFSTTAWTVKFSIETFININSMINSRFYWLVAWSGLSAKVDGLIAFICFWHLFKCAES